MRGKSLGRYHKIVLAIVMFLFVQVTFTVLVRGAMGSTTVGMDYSIYWMAGRAVFIEGANPYSDEMALQNQLRVLQRPSRPDEDQMAFAYPPYSLLLPLPTFWLSYEWAQSAWMVFYILILCGVVFAVFRQRAGPGILFILFLFPFSFGILLGNLVIPIAAALLLAFGLVFFGEKPSAAVQVFLGLLLAWTTVKPQFVWLYLLVIFAAALRKKLWVLIITLVVGAALMLAVSFVMIPDWVTLWLERMGKYTGYVGSYPMATLLLKSFLPLTAAYAVSAVIFAAALGISGVFVRRWWQGRLDAVYLLAWIGLTTYLIHPRNVSYAQIAFLLPLIVWALREKSWRTPAFLVFGLGTLVFSWVVFAIQAGNQANILLDEWRLLFHLFWVGWLFLRKPVPNPAPEVSRAN